jgi:hypothetical protein
MVNRDNNGVPGNATLNIDVTSFLHPGKNVIAFRIDGRGSNLPYGCLYGRIAAQIHPDLTVLASSPVRPSVFQRVNGPTGRRVVRSEQLIRAFVSVDGKPSDDFKVRFSLVSSGNGPDDESGHKHEGQRPHGWLYTGNRPVVEPLPANVLGGTTVAQLVPPIAPVNGEAACKYLVPELTGVETVRVEVVDPSDNNTVVATADTMIQVNLQVVRGLKRLAPAPVVGGAALYVLYAAFPMEDQRHERFWIDARAEPKLTAIAQDFADLQNGKTGSAREKMLARNLRKLVGTLRKKFRFALPNAPLYVGDISLPWGGLLDREGDWRPPHTQHRWGDMVDLATAPLVTTSRARSWRQAVGVSGTRKLSDTVKKARYIQFQLLLRALSRAEISGARLVTDENGSSNHLHAQLLPDAP